jgi:cytochrome c-type biogenesis protein CcmH/NrfG
MTDIKKLLQDADPLRGEETLSPAEAQALRTAMLETAATAPRRIGSVWHRPLAVAAIVVVLIGLSGITRNRSPKQAGDEPRVADPVQGDASNEKRQIQFATPGGTRIIWILDPAFSLQDSLQETKP